MKTSGAIGENQIRHEPVRGALYAGILCFAIASTFSTISALVAQSYPVIAIIGLIVSFSIAMLGVVFWVKFKVWRFICQAR